MVSKRYSHSWSLTGIFTVGKATDDNSSFGTDAVNSGNIVNPLHPSSQHDLSDFSVAKRLSLDGTFVVPDRWNGGLRSKLLAGWRLEEIGIFQSGLPFPVYCSGAPQLVYTAVELGSAPFEPLLSNPQFYKSNFRPHSGQSVCHRIAALG